MEQEVFTRMARQEETHWWFRSRRRIVASLLKALGPSKENPAILEAGCGTGGNLEMLSGFGSVKAFEIDPGACTIAREHGAEVREGSLPDANPYAGQKFDLIILLDVLEHIEDDQGSLKSLSECLTAEGRIFITVPAFSFLWSRHDEIHHHFRRYRRPELLAKLREAGLEPVRCSYFNFWLFPVIASIRWVKGLVGSQKGDEEGIPAPMVNNLLAGIFSSERFILPRMSLPLGVSLLAVARPGRKP